MAVRGGSTARRRAGAAIVAVATVATLVAVATTRGSDAVDHQPADEIEELSASLPDALTPLDPDEPNPTGDDPLAIGAPPDVEPAASPERFLARAEARRAAGTSTGSVAKPAEAGGPDLRPETVEDTLLVSFAPGTSGDTIDAALAGAGADGDRIGDTTVAEVSTAGGDAGAITGALEAIDAVESVEPDVVRRIDALPDDPSVVTQAQTLDTVHLPEAWEVADTGGDVVVAVLDTGVDLDHPDLAPNLVPGYDAVGGDSDPSDDHGHGTQVAGVIGAVTDNGVGVAGVAWNTRVMPVKVLDSTGSGTDADVLEGVDWAIAHGADVINMSFGGYGNSAALDAALRLALANEVVVVAAAGNDGARAPSFPAAGLGVVGVTATDPGGRFAAFSNHGPWYALSAPGIDIRTTAVAPGPAGRYTSAAGTSFSAPIVAGVAALVLERHPAWGWFEVADELVRTARDAGPAGVDDAYGFGIVDAAAALGVRPTGDTTTPDLTGDAGDVPAAARSIAVDSSTQESIGHEYDADWFAFDVPTAGAVTVTVTPPPVAPALRAAELDPVVELYGPGGGLVLRADDTLAGAAETLAPDLDAGRHTLRVTNYHGSAGPGPYTVEVALGDPLPATDPATGPGAADATVSAGDPVVAAGWSEAETLVDDAVGRAVAVADLTGDGRADVATATGDAGEVRLHVRAQDPDGGLGAPEAFATHASASSPGERLPLLAADLDGDGDTDLVLGTGEGLDVAWNDGSGPTAPVLVPVDGGVRSMQAADLTGDGSTELVVRGVDGLKVLRRVDDGYEADPGAISPTGDATEAAFDVADLTGDGLLDVVAFAGTGADARVEVHAHRPDGGWDRPTTLDMAGLPSPTLDGTLAAPDLDGDGLHDLVAVSRTTSGTTLAHRNQRAGGGFGATTVVPAAGRPLAVRTGDVTGDRRDDIVVLDDDGDALVLRQQADGTLAEDVRLEGEGGGDRPRSPDSLALGDIDGDGLDDIVTVDERGTVVRRHAATVTAAAVAEGAGPWLAASSPTMHATGAATTVRPSVTFGRDVTPSSVTGDTVALLDGRDGHVVPSSLTRSGRTVTLTPAAPLQPGAPYQVWIAGVTGPGEPGAAYEKVPFTTADAPAPRYDVRRTLTPVRIDIDGNGYDDIFWYAPGTEPDSIWYFGTDGLTGVSTGVRGTYTPVVGDFDGNGYEEMFWYGPGSGTDVMWWNSRDGFRAEVVTVRGVYVPIVGDFDRNGYDDIFWYGPGTAPDSIWQFGPDGRRSVVEPVRGTSYRPAAGDFDRDGYDDIVWYAPGGTAESLWRGSATGFDKAVTMSITGTYDHRTLDVDADGFDEVFLHQPDRGIFWRSGPTGFTSVIPGPAVPDGVRPVAGDMTGDGRDDLLAYVPGSVTDPLYPGRDGGVG